MKVLRREYGCPVEFAVDCLGGKWKTVILSHLKNGPKRYADLRRSVRPLSDKMLNERLLELLGAGLIEKRAIDGSYSISARGQTLAPVLQALYDWGQASAEAMNVRFRTDDIEVSSAAE